MGIEASLISRQQSGQARIYNAHLTDDSYEPCVQLAEALNCSEMRKLLANSTPYGIQADPQTFLTAELYKVKSRNLVNSKKRPIQHLHYAERFYRSDENGEK